MSTVPSGQNTISTSGVRNCDIARHVLSLFRRAAKDPVKSTGADKDSSCFRDKIASTNKSEGPSHAATTSADDRKSDACNSSVKVEESTAVQTQSGTVNLPPQHAKDFSANNFGPSQELARTDITPKYKQGQVILPKCRDNYELWVVPNIQTVHRENMLETICGILNSHRAGGIYFGVDKKGTVVGTPLSRKDRDEVRLGIDSFVTRRISPSLIPSTVDVRFVPVHTSDSAKMCNNLFVVEIHLFPSPFDLYTLNNGRCFIRKGKKHFEANFEDVYCLAIAEGVRLFSSRAKSKIVEQKCTVCVGSSHNANV